MRLYLIVTVTMTVMVRVYCEVRSMGVYSSKKSKETLLFPQNPLKI